MNEPFSRRLAAECLGSFFLFAAVIGSGIMAERLAGGNVAVALLANSIATGAMLYVLISALGPVSGAHFNPAVTSIFALQGDLTRGEAVGYVAAQLGGGLIAVAAVHAMFDIPIIELGQTARHGPPQLWSEFLATAGLILTILGTLRHCPERVAPSVAFYIVAAYWFTASTSFANPAITLARSLTDSFSGIAPTDAPGFMAAQMAGAFGGFLVGRWLFAGTDRADQP